jgi:hypothetical protein
MYRHHQFSGDPHPGNYMLWPTARAFLDFGPVQAHGCPEVELSSPASAPCSRDDAPGAAIACCEGRLPAHPSAFDPDNPLAVPRLDVVVHDRRGDRARAEIATAGDDRWSTRAPRTSARCATRTCARAPLRPAHGDAHAGGPRPAARHRELAPHRPEWMYGDEPVTELGRGRRPSTLAPRREHRCGWPPWPRPWALALVAVPDRLARHEHVRDMVATVAGAWAPLLFIPLSAALSCAFLPGQLLAGASGLLFARWRGRRLSIVRRTLAASQRSRSRDTVGARRSTRCRRPRMRVRRIAIERGASSPCSTRGSRRQPLVGSTTTASANAPAPLRTFARPPPRSRISPSRCLRLHRARRPRSTSWGSPEAIAAFTVLDVMASAALPDLVTGGSHRREGCGRAAAMALRAGVTAGSAPER